jgi:hypothetical protein
MTDRKPCAIKIGRDEDELSPSESIQFMDVVGQPRLIVNAEGELEILYSTSGGKKLCVMPVVGNVVQIGIR